MARSNTCQAKVCAADGSRPDRFGEPRKRDVVTASKNSKNSSTSKHTWRRTGVVWLTFGLAMTLVVVVLKRDEVKWPGGFLATNLSSINGPANQPKPAAPIFRIDAPVDQERWKGIVIHHLGAPAGDAESIHRLHRSYGFHGLGYHFLIGNGNGLGDGVVHVGYRWNQQLPGVHTIGPNADYHNQHSIGICLIGNGDRRPFTDRQIRNLQILVDGLQRGLELPRHVVKLHRDTAPEVSSPGKFFPAAEFQSQLANPGR